MKYLNKKPIINNMECFVCNNNRFVPAFKFYDELIKCTECGIIMYKEIFNPQIRYTYDYDYFEGRYYDYLKDKNIAQKNFSNRLNVIKQFMNKGKLLEIGCAYGFFLELSKKNYEVYGIDIAEVGIKYAKDVLGLTDIECGGYLEKIYPKNYFDIICMFDTIEHLNEPQLFLSKAVTELKKGGILCLTTGDIGSFNARIRKQKWRLIYPPEHQVYFSIYTMQILLKKLGMKIVSKSHPGYYRSLGLILYLTIFKNKKSIIKNPFFKFIDRIPVYLNFFDIMYVIAQKE